MAPPSVLLLQARNLGLVLDSFCSPLRRSCWIHLRSVSQIHPLLSTAVATTIVPFIKLS